MISHRQNGGTHPPQEDADQTKMCSWVWDQIQLGELCMVCPKMAFIVSLWTALDYTWSKNKNFLRDLDQWAWDYFQRAEVSGPIQLWPVLWVGGDLLYCKVTVSKWIKHAELFVSYPAQGRCPEAEKEGLMCLLQRLLRVKVKDGAVWPPSFVMVPYKCEVLCGNFVCFPCNQHMMHASPLKCCQTA